jgi:hypothetical protein
MKDWVDPRQKTPEWAAWSRIERRLVRKLQHELVGTGFFAVGPEDYDPAHLHRADRMVRIFMKADPSLGWSEIWGYLDWAMWRQRRSMPIEFFIEMQGGSRTTVFAYPANEH